MNNIKIVNPLKAYFKKYYEEKNTQNKFTKERIYLLKDYITDTDFTEFVDTEDTLFSINNKRAISRKQATSLVKLFPNEFSIVVGEDTTETFVIRQLFFDKVRKYLVKNELLQIRGVLNDDEILINKTTSLFEFYDLFSRDDVSFNPESSESQDLFDDDIPLVNTISENGVTSTFPVRIMANVQREVCNDDRFIYEYVFLCPNCGSNTYLSYREYKNLGPNTKCQKCIEMGEDAKNAFSIKKESFVANKRKELYHYIGSINGIENQHITSFNKLNNQKYELRGYLTYGKHMMKDYFLNINAKPTPHRDFLFKSNRGESNIDKLIDRVYEHIEASGVSINRSMGRTAFVFFLMTELPFHFGYDATRIMHMHIFGPQSVGKSFLLELLISVFYSTHVKSSGNGLITYAGLFGAANQDIALPEYSIKRSIPGALSEHMFFHDEMLSSFIDKQDDKGGRDFIDTYKDAVINTHTSLIKAGGGKMQRKARIVNAGNYDKTHQKKIEAFVRSKFNEMKAFDKKEESTNVFDNANMEESLSSPDLAEPIQGKYSQEFLDKWNEFDIDRDLDSDYYTPLQRRIIQSVKSQFENDKIDFYTGLHEELMKRFVLGVRVQFKARNKISASEVNPREQFELNRDKLYFPQLGNIISHGILSDKEINIGKIALRKIVAEYKDKYDYLWKLEPDFGTRYFIPLIKSLMRINNDIGLPSKETLDFLEKMLYFSSKQITMDEYNTFIPKEKINWVSEKIVGDAQ